MIIADCERDRIRADEYLDGLRGAPFVQSSRWASVKIGWRRELVLAEGAGGRVTGVMSLLIRPVPVFGNVIYCPRQAICSLCDPDRDGSGGDLRASNPSRRALHALPTPPSTPSLHPLHGGLPAVPLASPLYPGGQG